MDPRPRVQQPLPCLTRPQGSTSVPGLDLRDHGGHCQDNWWGPGRQHCGQELVTVITEEPHIPGEEG